MKLANPKLDEYGFPIPQDFDEPVVEKKRRESSGETGRRVRFVLRTAVLIGLAALTWHELKLSEKVAKHYYRRALLHSIRHEFEQSLTAIDRALFWKPRDANYLCFRAKLHYKLGDSEDALVDLTQALELEPRNAEAHRVRQAVFHRLGRHREAADSAAQMLGLAVGDEAEALNNRAYARAVGEFELDDALTDIERALALDGDNAAYLDTRGYVQLRRGECEAARADFERAIRLVEAERDGFKQRAGDPVLRGGTAREYRDAMQAFDHDLAVMYHHRGEALDKLGDREQARRDIEMAERLGYDRSAGIY